MADAKIDTTDGFKKAPADSDIEGRIARHCEKHGIDPVTAVKSFAVLSRRQALKRFLAHVELFKMTLGVPGDFAESGCSAAAGCSPGRTCSNRTASAIGPSSCTASTIGRASPALPSRMPRRRRTPARRSAASIGRSIARKRWTRWRSSTPTAASPSSRASS